ncbi:unnamed protein product, partial [Rotaria socialis]
MTKDYYEILQVTRIAKDADIKSSYHRLALKFHPATNPDDLDVLYKFHDLAEAY